MRCGVQELAEEVERLRSENEVQLQHAKQREASLRKVRCRGCGSTGRTGAGLLAAAAAWIVYCAAWCCCGLRCHSCAHTSGALTWLQELQAELEQRDADKQAMQKTIASLQQCDAPAGERPSEAAELLAARKTIANLQRALREVENASGVDDELAELRADAAKLRKASAEARQAERREAAAKQVRRISASAAHGGACVWL